MKEQSELLNTILELLTSNARSDGIAPENVPAASNEVIARPMVRNEKGKLAVKSLLKADILEVPPACVTAPCEDFDALYDTLGDMVERKVNGVFKDTFHNNAPSWNQFLSSFKKELYSLCHARALDLNVDLSRCEDNWCLHHLIQTKYSNKRVYQEKLKRELEAKKAGNIALRR